MLVYESVKAFDSPLKQCDDGTGRVTAPRLLAMTLAVSVNQSNGDGGSLDVASFPFVRHPKAIHLVFAALSA